MKKVLFMIVLVAFLGSACGFKQRSPSALVARPPDATARLSKKDRFQAGQWLKLALQLEMVGEYTTSWDYCRKISTYYPDTLYSEEAELLMEAIGDPARNRRRDFYRDNPALFLGY